MSSRTHRRFLNGCLKAHWCLWFLTVPLCDATVPFLVVMFVSQPLGDASLWLGLRFSLSRLSVLINSRKRDVAPW